MLQYAQFGDQAIKLYKHAWIKGQITYWQDSIRVLQQRSEMDPEWRAAKMRNSRAMLGYWQAQLSRSGNTARNRDVLM